MKKVNKENNIIKEKINKKEKNRTVKNDIPANKGVCTKENRGLVVECGAGNNKVDNKEMAEYRETLFPMPEKQKATGLAMNELSQLNPHNVPHYMIEDWLTMRHSKKKPVTPTAWSRLNSQLSKLDDAIEGFEIMVAHGWMSLNAAWIANIKGDSDKKSFMDNDLESTDWTDRI